MRNKIFFLAVLASASIPTLASAATLMVGPGQTYTTIAEAADAANDGDTILIAPGTYTEGAIFRANGLTIASDGGPVTVRDGTVNGQGLFVLKGNDTVVDGIRFENAAVPDANGAGIRNEGVNLTVLNSFFTETQNGILDTSQDGANSTLVVRNSVFDNATSLSGLTHEVYAASILKQVVVENSTFLGAGRGHAIKSRALSTIVRGNQFDDEDEPTSYMVEAARGGRAVVEANVMTRQETTENNTMIAFGAEFNQPQNPAPFAYVGDNVVTNNNTNTTFFNNAFIPGARPGELHENAITNNASGFQIGQGTFIVTTDGAPAQPHLDDDFYTFQALAQDGPITIDLTDERFEGSFFVTQVTLGTSDLFPEGVVLEFSGPNDSATISLDNVMSSFSGTGGLTATVSQSDWLNIFEVDLAGSVFTSVTLTDGTLDNFAAVYDASRFETFGFRVGDLAFDTAPLVVAVSGPASLPLFLMGAMAMMGLVRRQR